MHTHDITLLGGRTGALAGEVFVVPRLYRVPLGLWSKLRVPSSRCNRY